MRFAEMLAGLHPDQRQSLKRMAVHVTSLLPADEREALCVLAYAQELITEFLARDEVLPSSGSVTAFKPRRDARFS